MVGVQFIATHEGVIMSSCVTALAVRTREAARMLSVSERTIRVLLETGRLRAVRVDRAVLIPRQEIENFLAGDESEAGRE